MRIDKPSGAGSSVNTIQTNASQVALTLRAVGGLPTREMRLEAPARPDPLHGGRTDIAGLRHRPAAPMRLAVGPAFLRQPDDLLDLARRDRRLAAAPLGHPAELPQPVRGEPLAPADYGAHRDPALGGDPRVGDPVAG